EESSRREYERDASNRFAMPSSGHTRERIREHPPPSFTRDVHAIHSQWLHILLSTRNPRHQGADQVGTVQANRRGQVQHCESGKTLIHVAAQEIGERPACPLRCRPERALLRATGPTYEVRAPEG